MRIASLAVLFIFAAAVGSAVTFPAPAEARSSSCANAVIRNQNGTIYTQTRNLRATRVSCRTARRVALDILHGTEGTENPRSRSHGFTCSAKSTGTGVACRSGSRLITWSYR